MRVLVAVRVLLLQLNGALLRKTFSDFWGCSGFQESSGIKNSFLSK